MRTSTAGGVVVLTAGGVFLLGSGAALLGSGVAAASPPSQSAATEGRDPLLWPFARTSIWNTPIGSTARYVPARIRSTGVGVDVDWFVVTRRRDPAVPVHMPATFGEGRCRGTGDQQQAPWHPEARRKQHLPRSFVLPDAITYGGISSTPNSSSAFLQPDRRTIVSYNVTARCRPGGPLYGQWFGETSLYGDGIAGGHGGSGMSSIGGSIRTGELTGRTPIRHALKLDVWGRYLFYDAATGGKRWPALLADGRAAQQYTGSVTALRMGALLALPPSATAARLGVRSAAGRKVLAALRDYGGYVVDDSGLDAVDLCVEHQATVDFRKRTGHDIEADVGLRADMARMVKALAVVDDNSVSTVGGHGPRRAAWAPPFRTAGASVSAVAVATPGATPAATSTPSRAASAIGAAQVADLEPVRRAPAPTVWALVLAALGLLCAGLWGGRRLAGGTGIMPRRGL